MSREQSPFCQIVAFGRKWWSRYTYQGYFSLDSTNVAKELSRQRIKDGKGRQPERAIPLKRSPHLTLRNGLCQMSGRMSYADETKKWFKYKNSKLRGEVLIYRLIHTSKFLLTELESRTLNYRLSFLPIAWFMAQLTAKRAGHKSKGKKRGSVTCSTGDREDEVSKIFIISLLCVWRVLERFLFTLNGFKFLSHIESKTSQFEIVFKSLARVNTQFRVKESFN